MNKIMLAMVSLFNPLWRVLGVDVMQLRTILDTKLRIDDRRPNVYNRGSRQGSTKPVRNSAILTMVLSFFIGMIYLSVFTVGTDIRLQTFLWFSAYLLTMCITLITDFSYVLIDPRDNYILLPRPVSDRTLVVSRLLHIALHISKLAVPMGLSPFLYICYFFGVLPGLWFALLALMLTFLAIFLINLAYLLVLRITSAERFKEVINSMQIVFSIVMFGVYFLGPRVLRNIQVEGVFRSEDFPWLPFAPTWWFAGSFSWLVDGWRANTALSIALAFLTPMVCLWVVVRFLAPSFNRKIAGMGASDPAPPVVKTVKAVDGKEPFYRKMSRLFAKGGQEQLSFELVWLLTARTREFKLKVYPSIAYVFVITVGIVFFSDRGSFQQKWGQIRDTPIYLFLIYMSSFIFITAISQLVYSEKYKAAWVYFTSPLEAPGPILVGAWKAALVKFLLPVYAGVSVFAAAIWGLKILPDLILGFINVLVISLLYALIVLRELPFSAAPDLAGSSGKLMRNLLVMTIPGIIGLAHFLLGFVGKETPVLYFGSVALFAAISAAIFYLLYGSYRKSGWKDVKS
ncbi:hypothetical protein [Chitinophaga caseinilytica]|uniref:hypothetical protein n=1 Tax=Chitinophaga caseinilytica TaxID=2267521 RepID=UPI003C2ECF37